MVANDRRENVEINFRAHGEMEATMSDKHLPSQICCSIMAKLDRREREEEWKTLQIQSKTQK